MNDNEIPNIIYGTAWKGDTTTDLVLQAVKYGFRAIDTACQPKHYKEEGVGEAINILDKKGIKRDDLFIQTKFTPLAGQDINNIPYDKSAKIDKQVLESFEVSKKNLQTSYVDALILHSVPFPSSELFKAWSAMEVIYNKEEALQLGISNYYDLPTLKKLYKNSLVKPSIVQNRFYEETGYDKEIRLWCKDNGVIYQSFWTLTANQRILTSRELIKLALKYKKSEAQIFFNFISHEGIVPLSGTTSLKHMQDDLIGFDFILTDEEYSSLKKLL